MLVVSNQHGMFCRNYVVPLKFVSMFIILSLCETLLRHVQQIKPSYTEAVCISLFFFYLTNLSEKTVMAREVERSTFCCGDQIFQVTMNKMTRSTVQSQRNRVRFPSKRKTKQAC